MNVEIKLKPRLTANKWAVFHVHNLEDKSYCECLIYILCYGAFSWLLIPMTLMDGAKWFISSLPLNLRVLAWRRDSSLANLPQILDTHLCFLSSMTHISA